ncbi:LysM peptidoglycan-binding domain-containing protein [Geodermatophilus sp. URMC 62]|uniref:LysM peptidoglycan-binding domain-containing protein n=1 Tax=Geodermatophilus sp. URMC 62 TaxID=3423414 RepID=UPI00406C9045
MTEQDGRGSGRREVEVDALFAAQQSERRRQRLRVAAVTTAALAAGGLVGGLAAGVIDGDDGGRPSADGVGTSAGVSPEAAASASSGAEGSEDAGSEDAGSSDAADTSLPGSEATGQPGDDEVSSLSPAPGSGGGLNGESGDSSQGGPSTAQPGGTAEQSPTAPAAQPARHVVQVGESLWTITAQLLGDQVSAQQVLDRWPEVYAANRDLIGPDPDLLRPGQELVLPQLS